MTNPIIQTRNVQDFFKRGRQLGKAADRGERLPSARIISFEDPADLMRLMTITRLTLFRTVKEMPGSITDIATRLQRDRSAVKRDLDKLARVGLVTMAERSLPGHGRMKEVRATAHAFSLRAEVA